MLVISTSETTENFPDAYIIVILLFARKQNYIACYHQAFTFEVTYLSCICGESEAWQERGGFYSQVFTKL